jgi:hypothetical protein
MLHRVGKMHEEKLAAVSCCHRAVSQHPRDSHSEANLTAHRPGLSVDLLDYTASRLHRMAFTCLTSNRSLYGRLGVCTARVTAQEKIKDVEVAVGPAASRLPSSRRISLLISARVPFPITITILTEPVLVPTRNFIMLYCRPTIAEREKFHTCIVTYADLGF